MQCPKCHEPSPDGASFCRRCGTALAAGPGASPIIIGRDAGCTLQINSPRISSRHASLTPQPDGRYLLQDLGSSNGVFVGSPDNRVKSAQVGLNEVIYLADRSFRVAEIVGGLRQGAPGAGPVRLRIGREADNDIVIKDESVSRHHAVLERDASGAWWLEDLGSNNGTKVNGQTITRQAVSAADALRFGPYETKAGPLMAKAPTARAVPWLRAGSAPPSPPPARRRAGLRRLHLALQVLALIAVAAAYIFFFKYYPAGIAPDTAVVSAASPPVETSNSSEAYDLAEQATVLVIAEMGRDLAFGTGFFISDGLVVTNRHVAGAKGNRAVIINKSTGGLIPARVVVSSLVENRDYAVLSTEPIPSIKPLSFNLKVRRGDKVSTWGYPSMVMAGDPKLWALLEDGDISAAPEVILTTGEVSAIHDTNPPQIIHTAVISQGNSGGPLVNERGEVLGINTMIRVDQSNQSNRQANCSLGAADLVNFLKANDVPHTVVE